MLSGRHLCDLMRLWISFVLWHRLSVRRGRLPVSRPHHVEHNLSKVILRYTVGLYDQHVMFTSNFQLVGAEQAGGGFHSASDIHTHEIRLCLSRRALSDPASGFSCMSTAFNPIPCRRAIAPP